MLLPMLLSVATLILVTLYWRTQTAAVKVKVKANPPAVRHNRFD